MKKIKRSARKQAVITAQEALQLLESAVSYCQLAGLNVMAQNGNNGTLGLFIPNAHYILTDNGTRVMFGLGVLPTLQVEPATQIDTLVEAVRCPNCGAAMKPRDGGGLKCTRCYYFLEKDQVNKRIGTSNGTNVGQ